MNSDVRPVSPFAESGGLSSAVNSDILGKNSWEKLAEFKDLFLKSLKLGRVRGVVGVVDPVNHGNDGDSGFMHFIREMVSRDILVIVSCVESFEMGGVEMIGSDLLQNTGDGLAEFCDFVGIHPVLFVDDAASGSEIFRLLDALAQFSAVEVLNFPVAEIAQGAGNWQAGSFVMGADPAKTADLVDAYIHEKRLGVHWCDRCGGHFSPFS